MPVSTPSVWDQILSLSSIPASCSHAPGRQQVMAPLLESLPPMGRPRLSSRLPALAWCSPGHCRHLGNGLADRRSRCLFLCPSVFQRNKNKLITFTKLWLYKTAICFSCQLIFCYKCVSHDPYDGWEKANNLLPLQLCSNKNIDGHFSHITNIILFKNNFKM